MFRLSSRRVLRSKNLLLSLSLSSSSLSSSSFTPSIFLIRNIVSRYSDNNKFNLRTIIRYSSTSKDTTNSNSDGKVENNESNDDINTDGKDNSKTSNRKDIANIDDDYDDYEEPITPRDKVRHYFAVGFRLVLLVGGIACIGYLLKEMFPGRMSPGSLYSEAFEIVRINDEILLTCGEGMKAFGADRGRNEGRRNHIDSRQYVAEDGSNRTRVRFHVKGPRGHVIVWAEVSKNLDKPDLVYLICRDKRTGRVITIQDNRALLESRASTNPAKNDTISKLLGTFNK